VAIPGPFVVEITTSSPLKVDFDGTALEGDDPTNEAGHLIHTAVLKARRHLSVLLSLSKHPDFDSQARRQSADIGHRRIGMIAVGKRGIAPTERGDPGALLGKAPGVDRLVVDDLAQLCVAGSDRVGV